MKAPDIGCEAFTLKEGVLTRICASTRTRLTDNVKRIAPIIFVSTLCLDLRVTYLGERDLTGHSESVSSPLSINKHI